MSDTKLILLAEDNPRDAELTMEALSEYALDRKVTLVKDGVEALEYLRFTGNYQQRPKENPVVILLDIKMPRMDGIRTLTEIRNDPALKTIPVVMLTSSREEPDLKKCYELGVNAYVVKPVDYTDFIEAVKQVGAFWAFINELPGDRVK